MGRTFDMPSVGRQYSIRVVAIDEGWEVWVYEGPRRLLLGGVEGRDAALAAWRAGKDPVAEPAERIGAEFAAGRLTTRSRLLAASDNPAPLTSSLRSSGP